VTPPQILLDFGEIRFWAARRAQKAEASARERKKSTNQEASEQKAKSRRAAARERESENTALTFDLRARKVHSLARRGLLK